MNKVDVKGLIAGAIVWFILVILGANSLACLKYKACQSDDFMLFAMMVIGFLAPAYIVAILMSRE